MTQYDHAFDALELDPLPAAQPTPPAPRRRQPRDTVPLPMPADTMVVQPPAPAPPLPPGDNGGAPVNPTVRSIAAEEAALAKELGFKVGNVDSGLAYAAGTELWDIGRAVLEAADRAYQALPTALDAARTHEEAIKAEARLDSVVPLARFRVDPRGDLRSFTPTPNGGGQFGSHVTVLSAHAYDQLAKRCGGPNVNRGLPGQGDARLRTRLVAPAPGEQPTGARECFAALSAGKRAYTPYDTDRVLWDAARALPDCKAEVTYDRDTTTMRARIIAQAPIDIPEFVGVGRVHRVGIDLWSADNGTMSIRANPFIIRVRCKNATLVSHGHTTGMRRRHMGAVAEVQRDLQAALEAAGDAVAAFRDLWARKATEHYLDADTGANLDPREALARLVHEGYLPKCGLAASDAVEAYQRAWEAEPVYSAMGVVMAAQRAAHESSWKTRWADEEVEEAASKLLYAKVYRLSAPEVSA